MTTFGIAMVKDELDVIEPVIRHTAMQVDQIIIADNESSDGTHELLQELSCDYPITVVTDREVGYFQSRKMSALAEQAGDAGADWIVPFDADEIWLSRYGRLGTFLDGLAPEILLVQAILYDHVATPEGLGWRSLAANPLTKVACRYHKGVKLLPGNHRAIYPWGGPAPAILDSIVVRHFPYRSPEQMISKARNGARAYAATNGDESVPEDAGVHKRAFGELTDAELTALFYDRFWSAKPGEDPDLVLDPCIL